MAARAPRRSSQLTQKINTLLGGPFHSGAPRLCLPCLPCRDATACAYMDIKRLIFHKYCIIFMCLSTCESLSRINKIHLPMSHVTISSMMLALTLSLQRSKSIVTYGIAFRATVYINVWNRNHAPSRFRIPLLGIPNDSDSDSTNMNQKWFRLKLSLESQSE